MQDPVAFEEAREQKRPGGQARHSEADFKPEVLENVPGGQAYWVRKVVPAGQKYPGGHTSGMIPGFPVPDAQANPSGQTVQSDI